MTRSQPPARPKVFSATPVLFDVDGDVDTAAMHRLYSRLAGTGVDGLFVAGTTGEFPALDDRERVRVFETAVDAAGPDAVIAHVGAASARQAVWLTEQALRLGIRRLAAITPFYLPAGRPETVRHFARIAEAAEGAVLYVYAFEQLTNNPVTPELLAELASLPGISGIKLSGVPGTELVRAYLAATPAGFEVLTGTDRDLAAVARAGGAGVVSGVSTALPEPFLRLADAVHAGDAETEDNVQPLVDAAVDALGGSIAALKAGLSVQGFPERCRMPIAEPTDAERAVVEALMRSGCAGGPAG